MPLSVPNAIRTPAFTHFAKPSRCASVVSSFLRSDVGRPALGAAGLGDVVAAVDVGDQVGAGCGHQLDRLVVHERAVLDRAHAGADGALDALGAVRVRGDVGAVQRGLLDGGPDLAPR